MRRIWEFIKPLAQFRPDFLPRYHFRGPVLDFLDAPSNLSAPRLFVIGITLAFDALHQSAGKVEPLVLGQIPGGLIQAFRVSAHELTSFNAPSRERRLNFTAPLSFYPGTLAAAKSRLWRLRFAHGPSVAPAPRIAGGRVFHQSCGDDSRFESRPFAGSGGGCRPIRRFAAAAFGLVAMIVKCDASNEMPSNANPIFVFRATHSAS